MATNTTEVGSPPTHEPESPVHVGTADKHNDDADTCRICRGEGTVEEPLFFPCKCSGSIKYVHQDCLMEWLSHSQKKYCELCKTSFRFTKLYHPGMPSRIPTTVFIRRAALHVLRMLVTWCRGVLVASVWLLLLPFCMRQVWRSLFWVGDGGWSRERYGQPLEKVQAVQAVNRSQSWSLDDVRTALASANDTNSSLSIPFATWTNGEPLLWTIVKRYFFGFAYLHPDFPYFTQTFNTTTNSTGTYNHLGSRNPSLLSGIPSLKLFSSQAANRFIIDILEGQIITLVVVVAFILIFLIREWVVQQQPVLQVAQAGAAQNAHNARREAGEEVDDDEEEDGDDHDDVENREDPNRADVDGEEENAAAQETMSATGDAEHLPTSREGKRAVFTMLQESEDVPKELRDAMLYGSGEDVAKVMEGMPLEESLKLSRILAAIKDRVNSDGDEVNEVAHEDPAREQPDVEASSSSRPDFPTRTSSLPQDSRAAEESAGGSTSANTLQRPNMPSRDRSFIATEIRRGMEEAASRTQSGHREGILQAPRSRKRPVPDSWVDEDDADSHPHGGTNSDQEQGSDHSNESWQQVPDLVDMGDDDQETNAANSDDKGKEKVIDSSSANSVDGQATPPSEEEEDSVGAEHDSTSAARNDNSEAVNVVVDDDVTEEQGARDPPAAGAALPIQRSRSLFDIIMDWLFADVTPAGQPAEAPAGDDEHVVEELANEAPFVPFVLNERREAANPAIQDPEVAAAAAQAGIDLNDQDAIDDAEDIEGIMELIGMQGPLTGLFQNAMFSAVLISATLAAAVWFPYLWGKIVLLFMGSPISLFIKLPLQVIAWTADLFVDFAICIGAGSVFWATQFLHMLVRILSIGTLTKFTERLITLISDPAKSIVEDAMDRIGNLLIDSSAGMPRPDYFGLSVNSHAALRTIQSTTSFALNQTEVVVGTLYERATAQSVTATVAQLLRYIPSVSYTILSAASKYAVALVSRVWNAQSYKITLDLDIGRNVTSPYTVLEPWSPTDRFIAVFAGYASFAIAGALYLKRGSPITSSQQGRKIEGIVAEILQQAGGVLKVILIISIEMLAFPLYCGLLLDMALLPLFKDASIWSRWQFARGSPWTSGFVHWFIGTCYMFHFALFVSMCRKIMRKGVLYFIRDPDDPTFHPVRDVLERSVTTQLRKIAFSALVYGALVIVCLGGVVWGLNRATSGVLPINWSSQAPSLEFPLDLLFYNFLTPLIIKFYKPSDGLHAAYEWWFKACARFLRLSNFLFGEKAKDQEGHHVRRTWAGWFANEKADPEKPIIGEDRKILAEDRGTNVYFMFDGRYVRAPASDQVRIPKGERVFVDVDQFNHRKDGESSDLRSVHNTDMVTMVYIPPWFRVRIALFVFTIWVFAAMTGIGITIVPLLLGRFLFSLFLPSSIEMNDIHAFSLGLYTLGSLAYSAYHLYTYASQLSKPIPSPLSTLASVASTASKFAYRALRFAYVWTALIFIVPFLFALLLEFYFLMPLHAYLGATEPHVVHIIQDWTLGFLYARLAARVIFSDRASRPALAFRALLRDGFLNPNAELATRCFLLPVIAIFLIAVATPASVAWLLNRTLFLGGGEMVASQVWRFSFPLVGMAIIAAWAGQEGVGLVNRWRMIVRDEVYLIGERLHNFGDRKPLAAASVRVEGPGEAA